MSDQAERPEAAFAPPVPPTAPIAPIAPAVATTFCRACGNGIDPRASLCPKCGVATGFVQPGSAALMNRKSTGVAILLSLLFTGAGHWYCGEIGRGFAFFGAAILAAFSLFILIGFLALPAVWIWAAIDANKCAERHNQRLLEAANGI